MHCRSVSPTCLSQKNKQARGDFRDRKGEVLFIDARNLGFMKDRVLRDFAPEDTEKIAGTFRAWKRRGGETRPPGGGEEEGSQSELGVATSWRSSPMADRMLLYEDVAGFCKSATLDEIASHDYVLTPGRYVGAPAEEDDGVSFAEKMTTLTGKLTEHFAQSNALEATIRKNLQGIGYEF